MKIMLSEVTHSSWKGEMTYLKDIGGDFYR